MKEQGEFKEKMMDRLWDNKRKVKVVEEMKALMKPDNTSKSCQNDAEDT